MNFSKYDTKKLSDEGVWMDIFSPDGAEKIAEFKVVGRDSKIMKRQSVKIAKKQKKKVSIDESERETFELLVACTLDWKDVLDDDDKVVKFDPDVAMEYYQKYPWLAEQVLDFVVDRTNFLAV